MHNRDESSSNAANRRVGMRFPAQTDTVEIHTRCEAKVDNESHGGIGVSLKVPLIAVGQTVDVNYDGVSMRATVRRVEPHLDGHVLLGLEWGTTLLD